MSKSIIDIGLDVGNSDTKTPLTTTYTGFSEVSSIPYDTTEAIIYDGIVYVPDIERFPYVRDKTKNNKCLILSLFGIAKEIIAFLSGTYDSKEALQRELNFIEGINLGVGLPPAHMTQLKDSLSAYYEEAFKDGISFQFYCKPKGLNSFETFDFNLKLNRIGVYPQGVVAALVAAPLLKRNPKDPGFLTNKYKKSGYYIIDFGGHTVDVIPVVDGRPRSAECTSFELGILKMYGHIEKVIDQEFGIMLSDNLIENILNNEPVAVSREVIEKVYYLSKEWVDRTINQIRKNGLVFEVTPVLFIGGPMNILESYIRSNENVGKCEYVILADAKANAIAYKSIISQAS